MKHVLLFDIDGVLVETRGYLRALQDTVAHFSRTMGLGELSPTEPEVRFFEAQGITSEWHMGAICVAALLIERMRAEPNLDLPLDWEQALRFLGEHRVALQRPDYQAWAAQLSRSRRPDDRTPEATMRLFAGAARSLPNQPASAERLTPLLGALLEGVFEYRTSPVMRVMQHLVLGSALIQEIYGSAPDFESEAYIERFDRPLLSGGLREKLLAALGNGLGACMMTLRPSLPPVGASAAGLGYSPEAELARRLTGLERMPCIGFGDLRWLAAETGADVGRLIKPHAAHGLAAIAAACSGDKVASLHAAHQLAACADLQPPLSNLPPLTVSVFEDTTNGLLACKQAERALREAGMEISCQGYGIAPSGSAKARALEGVGARVYAHVDQALLDDLSQHQTTAG